MLSISAKDTYVNKLKKTSIKCFSKNLHNAENAINYSHRFMSMIYAYLEKMKEELDSLDYLDIQYIKLLSIFNVNKIYTNEIDYIVTNAIYDDKNLILKSTNTEHPTQLEFALALPYNYENNYPIGLPISSAKNDYNFNYICPVLDCKILNLDIYLNPIIIKEIYLTVTNETIPEKLSLINCENGYGLFIKKENNNWIIHSYYNHSDFELNKEIKSLDEEISYGTINAITCTTDVADVSTYDKFSYYVTFLQYSIDKSLNTTFNEIDKISEYLHLCEINYKLLKTFKFY